MLEWVVNYQMLICGISYKIIVSFVTYHVFTYDIVNQLLGFGFC